MALRATIYKATVDVSDMDRGVYGTFSPVLAQHPSETEGRLMMRLVAYCLRASETLSFGRGLSTEGEPALFDTDEAGDVRLWIEVGHPSLKTVRKALGRCPEVLVLTWEDTRFAAWSGEDGAKIARQKGAEVLVVPGGQAASLEGLLKRTMRLAATVQDGTLWLSDDDGAVEITPRRLGL